jgi:chromate transport protein ChrA
MFGLAFVIIVSYIIGATTVGWLTGLEGEKVFGFNWVWGLFLWPLMLCMLLIYRIYDLFRKVIKTFKKRI